MQKKTALVTGASFGLGKAFCEVLAAKNYDIVLTARSLEVLEKNANYLTNKYKIKTYVIALDLAEQTAPMQLYQYTKSQQLSIDLLINNAGFGLKETFSKSSWQEVHNFINVLASSVTSLCALFLPDMVKKNYGRIINVSSIAAFMPQTPGRLYTPIKSYVVSLSKILAAEYSNKNIKITALCPGLTYTNFHDVIGNRKKVSQLPKILWMDASTVAQQGYQAVMSGKTVYINGYINRFMCLLFLILPNFVVSYWYNKKISK